MNRIQAADIRLRQDIKEIYAKNEKNVINTRKRLCEEAGFDPNTIYKFERGNHNLGFKLMSKLCDWVENNK